MSKTKTVKKEEPSAEDTTTIQIEEAAYYISLNRGRYSLVGDELNDWHEAEKTVRDRLG